MQAVELAGIFAEAGESHAIVLQQIIDGSIDRADASYARVISRREKDSAVREALTTDQLEIYDALVKLHHGGMHGHRPA